jgi:hypothetical protein
MRDPDGYLIEVGQYTQMALDHFKKTPVKLPSNVTPNEASMQSSTPVKSLC